VRSKPGQIERPHHEPKDVFREIAETVVFVVVLVLLLKTFTAEAFVIPTGSMAETLYGYHKIVTCPQCGYEFPVNCSSEVDPQDRPRAEVAGCICPNCYYDIDFDNEKTKNPSWSRPDWSSGDRVLVAKFIYDLRPPERYEVIVFKFPQEPQKNYVQTNYIKRLIGKPGETIAIYFGKLYVAEKSEKLKYEGRRQPEKEEDRRLVDYMYKDDQEAVDLFKGEVDKPLSADKVFQLFRKSPEQMLAVRRLVYDNDHQPKDLGQTSLRWNVTNESKWTPDDPSHPKRFQHAGGPEIDWLRYKHVVRGGSVNGQLITDFMGYNSGRTNPNLGRSLNLHWVGDLLLEGTVTVDKADKADELRFELSKGIDRFQARFEVASGKCTLVRLGDGGEKELASRPTRLKGPGKYRVRFANVDERLTVWVDSELTFDDGTAYDPPRQRGPQENDLQPASIGVRGATLSVSGLTLWRDTYYTRGQAEDGEARDGPVDKFWADPNQWDPLRRQEPQTLYVQPGHYLALGDNSPESADSRYWGAVPERLLLGRALVVYYPFPPFGNRAGPIK